MKASNDPSVIVAAQLPDSHPSKKMALEYVKIYESTFGAGSVSAFGSYTWDACLDLANAIPQALKSAQPGTKEFRRALRDALEGTRELIGNPALGTLVPPGNAGALAGALRAALNNIKELSVTNGAVNMTKTDHLGLDRRAWVMVQVKDGKWVLQN